MSVDCEVAGAHAPFLRKVVSRAQEIGGRYLVGLAGPPGAGKTSVARAWVRFLRREGNVSAETLPMDGFHRPNAFLARHSLVRGGREYTLREQKGCPDSFDAPALLRVLQQVRRGEQVSWPRYDRHRHEPVPGEAPLPAKAVLVVEGNYLLLDVPTWRAISLMLDLRVWMDVRIEDAMAAVRARHRRGGRTEASAEAHIRRCDRPNARLTVLRRLPPDAAFRRGAHWTLSPVAWSAERGWDK